MIFESSWGGGYFPGEPQFQLVSSGRHALTLHCEVILLKSILYPYLSLTIRVRRSNQSILKEIRPECSLEGLMLKLKLQYFSHLMQRVDSFEKTLMLGKIEAGGEGNDRGWDGWMASLTQWTWVWANSGDSEGQGGLACCSPWGCKESDITEWLKNNSPFIICSSICSSRCFSLF